MKVNEQFDALFLAASGGDERAYNELCIKFLGFGKSIAHEIITKYFVSSLTPDDLTDEILEIFLYVVSSYDSTKNGFLSYSSFVLRKRLYKFIQDEKNKEVIESVSLDTYTDDGVSLIERIEDPSVTPLPNQISLQRFKYEISSPKHIDSKTQKLAKKVMLLEMIGYRPNEIINMLKLSRPKFRYLKKIISESETIKNLKLELK